MPKNSLKITIYEKCGLYYKLVYICKNTFDMTRENPDLTARESIDLITHMIMEAKGNVQRNNFYFLLWGWVVIIANLGMYSLTLLDYRHPYIAWTITIPAWIYTFFRAFSQRKHKTVHTHFDTISGLLWMSFGITIFILVSFGSKINYQLNPVILAVSAMPTLVSGIILKFKPLIVGGIIFWLGAIANFMTPMESQPLIGAVTIACGYLFPGYMLRRAERTINV
jgi:hypothetical protein